jgi:hypothetical protein
VKLYAVPFFKPETLQLSPFVVQTFPAGAEVTTYLVMVEPPVLDGFDQETVAAALAATACTDRGVEGVDDNAYAGKMPTSARVKATAPAREVRVESRIENLLFTSSY